MTGTGPSRTGRRQLKNPKSKSLIPVPFYFLVLPHHQIRVRDSRVVLKSSWRGWAFGAVRHHILYWRSPWFGVLVVLQIQLPVNVHLEERGDGPRRWALPPTGRIKWNSWLWPGLPPAVVGTEGMNQWIQGLSLNQFLSHHLSNQ